MGVIGRPLPLLRLLRLSADEGREKLLEWNERNDISLRAVELSHVVQSA
jgi:hypothetical protein